MAEPAPQERSIAGEDKRRQGGTPRCERGCEGDGVRDPRGIAQNRTVEAYPETGVR